MQIDTFLKIGKNHKICEDYILSGTDPIPYIILSDGCSSSKGTDMGARLLCFLAQQYIKFRATSDKDFLPDHNEMGMWIIHNAELVGKQLGLPNHALDATLIIAYRTTNNEIRVHFYGDGCVIRFGLDYLLIGEIEYSKNAPYYLSYNIDPERNELFYQMHQEKIIKDYTLYPSLSTSKKWVTGGTLYPCDSPSVWNYDLHKDCNGLLIASDGISSFIKDREGLLSITDYIKEFITFKTTKGEFLKRRANRALKDLAKDNIHNSDDLSIGVFLLEER